MLEAVRYEFRRHRELAERALAELDDAAFFTRPAEQSNPPALIVKHLAGNLKSRWSDFLASDGDKPGRNRDREFVLEADDSRAFLMTAWREGWDTVEATFAALRAEDLNRAITIRGEPHTVEQALIRGLTHAAYHVGQILYLSRMLNAQGQWLTIPPGQSAGHRPGYLTRGGAPATDPSAS